MNNKILLIGMGSDIGSNLMYLSSKNEFKNKITDIFTSPIESDGTDSDKRDSYDELAARLVMAQPQLLEQININRAKSEISINDTSFKIHFGDVNNDMSKIGCFDLSIIATSRKHIRSNEILNKIKSFSKSVIGVAENSDIPAIYPALADSKSENFKHGYSLSAKELSGCFAMGSCQCVGWTTGLRIIAEYCSSENKKLSDVLIHSEVDIIHPDTASSNFGTKRIGSRTEDPRDNLRPGISQVAQSMQRFQPASSTNTVSLRVLTQPPGYQIQRFFLKNINISIDKLTDVIKQFENNHKHLIKLVDTPMGSKSYANLACSTVYLNTSQHLIVNKIGENIEVVLQAYVHNTLGYCAAIHSTIDNILSTESVTIIK